MMLEWLLYLAAFALVGALVWLCDRGYAAFVDWLDGHL